MPKEKRKNITGNSKRHAPLGQVIAEDENRSKYATVRSRQRSADASNKVGPDHEQELLDEKSTRRIFELGKEQLLEIEMEEQNETQRRKKKYTNSRGDNADSSDEEEEMDSGSILAEDDEDEE